MSSRLPSELVTQPSSHLLVSQVKKSKKSAPPPIKKRKTAIQSSDEDDDDEPQQAEAPHQVSSLASFFRPADTAHVYLARRIHPVYSGS